MWTINDINPENYGIDRYSKIEKFLVAIKKDYLNSINLDTLQGADMDVELEEASAIQKIMIFSSIRFCLYGMYPKNPYKKFKELNLKGVSFEEIMEAPDLTLHNYGSGQCSIFSHSFLDALIIGRMVFNGSDSIQALKKIIDCGKEGSSNFELAEKAFISTVLLIEPELILQIKQEHHEECIFKEITENHKMIAIDNIKQDEISGSIYIKLLKLKLFGKNVSDSDLSEEISKIERYNQKGLGVCKKELVLFLLQKRIENESLGTNTRPSAGRI